MRAGEHDKALYELSQKRYSVVLQPFRAEPLGYLSLKAHSCGIPSLIPTHAAIAPLISRFVTEPEYFIGKKFVVFRTKHELMLFNIDFERFLSLFVYLFVYFFVSNITRKRLD